METIIWFGSGALFSAFASWAWRLSFRDPVTIGTIIFWMIGIALPPVSLFYGVLNLIGWTFSDPGDQRYMAVKWSDEWLRARYRQHCFFRRLRYLGNPPKQEDILSGWRYYRPSEDRH